MLKLLKIFNAKSSTYLLEYIFESVEKRLKIVQMYWERSWKYGLVSHFIVNLEKKLFYSHSSDPLYSLQVKQAVDDP